MLSYTCKTFFIQSIKEKGGETEGIRAKTEDSIFRIAPCWRRLAIKFPTVRRESAVRGEIRERRGENLFLGSSLFFYGVFACGRCPL